MTTVTTSFAAEIVDPTDVATVTARELAFAVKLLASAGGSLADAASLSEEHIGQVEDFYWRNQGRASARKTVVLLRFRALAEVCRARRLNGLIANGGTQALVALYEAAAQQRLNTSWGFNPMKLARAVEAGLREGAAQLPGLAIAA